MTQDDIYKYFKKKDLVEDVLAKGKKIEELKKEKQEMIKKVNEFLTNKRETIKTLKNKLVDIKDKNYNLEQIKNDFSDKIKQLEQELKEKQIVNFKTRYENTKYSTFTDEEVDKEKMNKLYIFFLNNKDNYKDNICKNNKNLKFDELLQNDEKVYIDELINILGQKYIEKLRNIVSYQYKLIKNPSIKITFFNLYMNNSKNKDILNLYNEFIKDYMLIIDNRPTTISDYVRLYDFEILDILIKRHDCKIDKYNYIEKVETLEMLNNFIYIKIEEETETDKNNKNFLICCNKLFECFKKDSDIVIPVLLWIDSLHDFKETRTNKKNKKEELSVNIEIDQIKLDEFIEQNKTKTLSGLKDIAKSYDVKGYTKYNSENKTELLKQIFIKKEILKSQEESDELPNINPKKDNSPNENFLDYYVNLFFDKEHKKFSENCKETILQIPYIKYIERLLDNRFPEYLYGIYKYSNSEFEKIFFYKYISLNFKFNKIDDPIIIKKIEEIYYKNPKIDYSVYSILWKSIDFLDIWTQDFTKDSSVNYKINQKSKIYLPSSLIDPNLQTYQDFYGNFYSQNTGSFTVWSGHNFYYKYNKNNCKLKVTTKNEKLPNFSLTSSCETSLPVYNKQNKEFITSQTKFYYKKNNITKPYKYDIDLSSVDTIYFSHKSVGPSVSDIYKIIIDSYNKNNNIPLSFIDSMLSLKRIGDFGQIIESKLNNIPFFTDDKMEALISIAIGNTTITSCDDYIIWYDRFVDGLVSPISYLLNLENQDNKYCLVTKRNDNKYLEKIENINFGDFKLNQKDILNNSLPKELCS